MDDGTKGIIIRTMPTYVTIPLFPTIARAQHICCDNVVVRWVNYAEMRRFLWSIHVIVIFMFYKIQIALLGQDCHKQQ